jgi:hypothetical protein
LLTLFLKYHGCTKVHGGTFFSCRAMIGSNDLNGCRTLNSQIPHF